MARYVILRRQHLSDLCKEVNAKIEEGYAPVGGPFRTNPKECEVDGYAQAMLAAEDSVSDPIPTNEDCNAH